MKTADSAEDSLELTNKLINEEYKIWKKNAPYLYDVVVTHALTWPTLTCQWFPDSQNQPNLPYTSHRLLLGTHTSGQAQDYLQIATLHLPKRDLESLSLDRKDYDHEKGEIGTHKLDATTASITINQKINHPGEVNKARYMPQNPDLLASRTNQGDILIFDRTKHADDPDKNGVIKPDITLTGQSREGYGLAWNPVKSGLVIGASEDMTVCMWDINSYTKANSKLQPVSMFTAHSNVVGDVDWHATKEDIFASAGDDKILNIWDVRSPASPSKSVQAHDSEVLSLAFSPASEYLLVTGSADKTCALWDLRNLQKKLHIFESHTKDVLNVAWSPHAPTVFASGSSDRRLNIWDLSLINQEQTPEEAEEGPPELLFMHGGHTASPTDLCWAPSESEMWTLVSTSEDNIAMVWSPAMHIWAGEEVKMTDSSAADASVNASA